MATSYVYPPKEIQFTCQNGRKLYYLIIMNKMVICRERRPTTQSQF